MAAIKSLGQTLTGSFELEPQDADFLTTVLTARLSDASNDVVRATLGLGAKLLGFIPSASALSVLGGRVSRTAEAQCSPKLTAKICGFLASHMVLDNPQSTGAVCCVLLPLMVATEMPKTARLVIQAVGSTPLGEEGVFKGVAGVLQHAAWTELRQGSKSSAVAAANQALFSQLGSNLVADGVEDTWDSCDAVLSAVLQLSVDSPRSDDGPLVQCVLMLLSEAMCQATTFDVGLNLMQRSMALITTALAGIGPCAAQDVIPVPHDPDCRPACCPTPMYRTLAKVKTSMNDKISTNSA